MTRRCSAKRKEGSECLAFAVRGSDPPLCAAHGGRMDRRRCTAVCRDGSPCHNWAVRGTHPPRSGAHEDSGERPGAPTGNQNALKHGYYAKFDLPEDCSIEALIDDLYERQKRLNAYIDGVMQAGSPSIPEMVNLLRLHGRNTSRLARLLRDQRALTGEAADGISGAIGQALDELSTEWSVEP